jgi:hypothetical protein
VIDYLKALDEVDSNGLSRVPLEGPDKYIGVQFCETRDGGVRPRLSDVILAKEKLKRGRCVRRR